MKNNVVVYGAEHYMLQYVTYCPFKIKIAQYGSNQTALSRSCDYQKSS